MMLNELSNASDLIQITYQYPFYLTLKRLLKISYTRDSLISKYQQSLYNLAFYKNTQLSMLWLILGKLLKLILGKL